MTTLHLLIIVFFSISMSLLAQNMYRRTRIHKLYRIVSKDIEQALMPGQEIYTITIKYRKAVKTLNVSEKTYYTLELNQEILF